MNDDIRDSVKHVHVMQFCYKNTLNDEMPFSVKQNSTINPQNETIQVQKLAGYPSVRTAKSPGTLT
jgi:hypothetical protein